MLEIIIPVSCLSILIIFHLFETIRVKKIHDKIPLRICVTGTRGKSSVTRLIYAMLKQYGEKTLCKVSGSKPVLILPSGEQKIIKRRGKPSIVEQIRVVLSTAERQKVTALVSEIMSITPEFQICETKKILNPDILVITNVREDHLGTTGNTCLEIAEVFLSSAPENCRIIMLESEWKKIFSESPGKNITLVSEEDIARLKFSFNYEEFPENLALALKALEISGRKIRIEELNDIQIPKDTGVMEVWKLTGEKFAVNAFAANDPTSTVKVMERALSKIPQDDVLKIGLLVLRPDKGERTLQWCDFLNSNRTLFDEIYILGGHYKVAEKKLKGISPVVIREKSIDKIHEKYFYKKNIMIFGFGNFVGKGEEFKCHWEKSGTRL